MAKRRNFTPEFKAEVVLEALRGESSQAALCRRHNLSEQQLSKWKQHFLENAVSVFTATDKHGYRRVARLMREAHLCVSVKRVCQTTRSLETEHNYVNKVQRLEVSRCDQVWVGDITYVRLNRRFIYVAVLMDVFTRMIRGWHLGQQLTQTLTLKPLQEALHQNVAEIHHSD